MNEEKVVIDETIIKKIHTLSKDKCYWIELTDQVPGSPEDIYRLIKGTKDYLDENGIQCIISAPGYVNRIKEIIQDYEHHCETPICDGELLQMIEAIRVGNPDETYKGSSVIWLLDCLRRYYEKKLEVVDLKPSSMV